MNTAINAAQKKAEEIKFRGPKARRFKFRYAAMTLIGLVIAVPVVHKTVDPEGYSAAVAARMEKEAQEVKQRAITEKAERDAEMREALPLVAQEKVSQRLRDPDSAVFRDVRISQQLKFHDNVVCGFVNARNGFGGYTGESPFMMVSGSIFFQNDIPDWGPMWKSLC